MLNLKERLAQASPDFLALALGERSPPLAAFVAADGRVGRQTTAGLEWVALLPEGQRQALFAMADELFGGVKAFYLRDDDGSVLSGFRDGAGRGQVRVSLVPTRTLGADDFVEAVQPELFFFLQSLVRLGENVWILGDTGVEFELGAALVPDSHTPISKPPEDRPPPYRTPMLLGDVSLGEALQARDRGGFSSLVFTGSLGENELGLLAQRNGVVFCQQATSIERALGAAGLLQRRELAQLLPAIACVVTLQRSQTLGVMVAQLGEFRRSDQGVDYVPIAARGLLPDARMLALVQQPQTMQRLIEAGVEGVVFALAEAAPDDAMNIIETRSGQRIDDADDAEFDDDDDDDNLGLPPSSEDLEEESTFSEAEIAHRDPGWELDAASARKNLVQAPGDEGKSGLFRARPVVRPSAPADDEEPELGTLTLDAPPKKIIIPEAPSGAHQKRSFSEILRERHRFPPVSEKGPTLTPPVLDGGESSEDDDITP